MHFEYACNFQTFTRVLLVHVFISVCAVIYTLCPRTMFQFILKFFHVWQLRLYRSRSVSLWAVCKIFSVCGPPLWSSGQSFWLQIQRSRVRSPALPDFLSSCGYGTGSTEELLELKSSGSRSRKQRLTAVGIRCADHVTPLYPQKLSLSSPTSGGHSVCIV
jgi:hypothetical protein